MAGRHKVTVVGAGNVGATAVQQRTRRFMKAGNYIGKIDEYGSAGKR